MHHYIETKLEADFIKDTDPREGLLLFRPVLKDSAKVGDSCELHTIEGDVFDGIIVYTDSNGELGIELL